jgi:gamma-glutamylputrescine oxidase
MHVGIKPRQRDELKEWQREQEDDFGYRSLRFLERDEVAQWIASKRYIAGLLDTASGHLHPLRYTIGLGQAAKSAGVRLHEGTRVTRIEPGATVTVHTESGRVRAKHVALCANIGHAGLSHLLARKTIGIASYIVATRPLGEARAQSLLRDNIAVADINWIIDYYRRSPDHRLLFGGRVSYSGVDPLGTARATRSRMLNVFPQLADSEIEYAWGGMIDITMSRAPNFGRLEPNIYYLQGFSGHGMVVTSIAGKIVAEAIAGQAERFDVFARLRHHDFPGGRLLRRPTLVLAMTWFRLRDLLP